MLEEKTAIGPGLFFMLIFVMQTGYGFLQTPFLAAKHFGANGYWGVVAAFILALPLILALAALGKRFPQQSFVEYLPEIFGKPLGKILGFIYLLFLTFLFSWITMAIAGHYNMYFLIRTPFWVIVLVILGTQAFLARKGIEGLGRLSAFVFLPTLLLMIMTLIGSFQHFDINNVRPVFYFDPPKIPEGIIAMFYIYLPLAIILQNYRYLTDKNRGFRVIAKASALGGILIFLSVLMTIGTFGARTATILSWPFLELGRQTDIPYMLQTFGLVIAPVVTVHTIIGGAAFYYTVSQGLSELFGKLNYKIFVFLLFPLVLAAVALTYGDIYMRWVFNILHYVGFAVGLIFPLVVWLIAVLTRKGISQ